jgi:transposase, IS5 family
VSQSPGGRTPTIKRELRRRNAIEPVIDHTKSDGLLERNRLAGAKGGAINAILVGAGHNIRLLLAWLRALLLLLLAFAASALSTRNTVTPIAPNAI